MAELRFSSLLGVTFLAALALSGRLQFLLGEFPSVPRRIAAVLLLLAVLVISVFYPVATAGSMHDVDLNDVWFPTLFAGHICLGGFLAAWWWLSGRPQLATFLMLRRDSAAAAWRMGLVGGMVGWSVTIVTTSVIAAGASLLLPAAATSTPPHLPEVMVWLAQLPVGYKLTIIGVAMTVEEGFFRAFLQTRLGLWLSSALFAVAHFSYGLPYMVVAVMTISLIIGILFQRTGNLLACIAAHGMFDGIQLLVVMPLAVRLAT